MIVIETEYTGRHSIYVGNEGDLVRVSLLRDEDSKGKYVDMPVGDAFVISMRLLGAVFVALWRKLVP